LLVILALAVFAVGCGDVFRPVAVPITGPPGDPQSTSFAFVANNNLAPNPGSVLQINVPGDSAFFQDPTGVSPVFAAFLPPGQSRIYVANRDSDSLTTYIPSFTSLAPTTISLPSGSRPVFLGTTQTDKMYVANAGTNNVGVISGTQSALITEITVGATPVALAQTNDARKLYAVNQGDGTVSAIDTTSGTVLHTISVGTSPIWALLSPDGLQVYVLNQGSGSISVIDTTSDTVVATLTVGSSPDHMFLDTHLNRLYVVNNVPVNTGTPPQTDAVWIFNAAVDPPTPVTTVTLPVNGPTAITVLPNGLKAYVASLQPDPASSANVVVSATVINTTSNTVQSTRAFPSVPARCDLTLPFTQPGGVRFPVFAAASSDGNKAYISSCDAGVTHVLKTVNDSPITDIASPVSSFKPPTNTSAPPPQEPVYILPGP
jgi:YVTN family beta-propeller protein